MQAVRRLAGHLYRRARTILGGIWRSVRPSPARTKRLRLSSQTRAGATLLVGNKDDWRKSAREALTSGIKLSLLPLAPETIILAEIDAILPFLLSEYEMIRASAVGPSKSLVPSAANVALADDKLQFNNWLISSGFGHCVPKLFGRNPPFPFIRKKRIDAFGENTRIFFDEDELHAARVNVADPDYFLQECTPGCEEYVTHTISVRGTITYATTFLNFYDKMIYVKGTAVSPIQVEHLGGLVPPALSEILRRLDYSGCACFNYKMVGSEPMIFEMNPRVGASFSRVADEYLEGYLESVRWQQAHPA